MQPGQALYDRVDKASSGFSLSLENLLQGGLNHFRRAPGAYVLYSLPAILGFSNPISGILLGGPVLAGYYLTCRNLEAGRDLHADFFSEGMRFFWPLLILSLLISLLVSAGLLLLVIPGIYLALSFVFAQCFVIFHGCSPLEALRLSHRTVSGNFPSVFLLFIILAGINLLGIMLLGFGLLLSIPLSVFTVYAAFDDIIGIPKE